MFRMFRIFHRGIISALIGAFQSFLSLELAMYFLASIRCRYLVLVADTGYICCGANYKRALLQLMFVWYTVFCRTRQTFTALSTDFNYLVHFSCPI